MRRLALVVAIALAAAPAAVPAVAAAGTTLSGAAGAWGYVTLARETTFDAYEGPLTAVRATTGRFAGVALYDDRLWMTYTTGNTDSPCPYATRPATCPVGHLPHVAAYSYTSDTLPAGRYRIALVGEPGSRVSLRVRGGTFSTPVRWAGRGSTVVTSDAPVGPPDHQIASDNHFTFAQRGRTILGGVVRVDMDDSAETRVGYCARSSANAPSLPGDVVCTGYDLVSRNVIYSAGKGTCSGCFPGVPAFSLTVPVGGMFRGPAPDLRVHAKVVAKRSRITVTAFALTLPA